MSEKQCTKCKTAKPLSEFSKRSASKDGLCYVCKPCALMIYKEYDKANPEKSRARGRAWDLKNKEVRQEKNKIWRIENRESQIERSRVWQAENREKNSATKKIWRKANPDVVYTLRKNWFEANPEKRNAQAKAYRERHPGKCRALYAAKRARKVNAEVEWADKERIQIIYLEAKRLTDETGIIHHVDHVVPLRNKLVCGLHVDNNLQILTAADNLKKYNKFSV